MSEVYANAAVNIAAVGAKDGSVGSFFERDVLRESKQYVKINDDKIYRLREVRLYERCLKRICLTSRGWCFQELFLAKRTLHFTQHQIFFECNYEAACESNLQGLPDSTWMVNSPKHILPRDRNDPGAWYKAVSFYSSTQLTYAKDNLVAISGVARHIQSMTGDEYVSGLWRTGIEMQLCWRVDRDKIKPTELGSPAPTSLAQTLATPLPYPGPSWSWASVDEAISWELNDFHVGSIRSSKNSNNLSKVSRVEVIPVGDDSMGQLKNAKLKAKYGPFITGNAIMSHMELYKQTPKHGLDDREENSSPLFKADGYIWFDHECGDQQQSAESLYFLPVIE